MLHLPQLLYTLPFGVPKAVQDVMKPTAIAFARLRWRLNSNLYLRIWRLIGDLGNILFLIKNRWRSQMVFIILRKSDP